MPARDDIAPRQKLVQARRVVIKLGSQLLATSPAGRPADIADQIIALRTERQLEPIIVSSGAIAMGKKRLALAERPTSLPELQAVAAVGQTHLMQNWEHGFAAHGLRVAQLLMTHDDIANRRRFLNARRTLRAIHGLGGIPIVNENDTVATEELTYGDNDQLAGLLCNVVSADALIILTSVAGVLDSHGQVLPTIADIDTFEAPVVGPPRTHLGSGGIRSKVSAARIAARHGVPTVVADGTTPHVVTRVLGGENVGTLIQAQDQPISSRKHWIAFGTRPRGQLVVDKGAHKAVADDGKSLLAAGITAVHGDFGIGDLVSVCDGQGAEFARGLVGYSAADSQKIAGIRSTDIEAKLGYKYIDEVIHRDDLVLL